MSEGKDYDYSATEPFLEPFTKWVKDEPFFSDELELYGQLWQFKSLVADWTFGMTRLKDYVFLRYRVLNTTQFLNWNLNEKVANIENHHGQLIVITLEAVNNGGSGANHCHSIVIHDDDNRRQFEELLNNLHAANNIELVEDLS